MWGARFLALTLIPCLFLTTSDQIFRKIMESKSQRCRSAKLIEGGRSLTAQSGPVGLFAHYQPREAINYGS